MLIVVTDSHLVLSGLSSAKDFQVTVKPDLFTLHAEGRYRLVKELWCHIVYVLGATAFTTHRFALQSLPLNPFVNERPELLRFVKKKAVLKV